MADTAVEVLVATVKAEFESFRTYIDDRIVRIERAVETSAHKDDVVLVQSEVQRLEVQLRDATTALKEEIAKVDVKADKADKLVSQADTLLRFLKWFVGILATGGGSVGLYEGAKAVLDVGGTGG